MKTTNKIKTHYVIYEYCNKEDPFDFWHIAYEEFNSKEEAKEEIEILKKCKLLSHRKFIGPLVKA
jgi:hypothetical protein